MNDFGPSDNWKLQHLKSFKFSHQFTIRIHNYQTSNSAMQYLRNSQIHPIRISEHTPCPLSEIDLIYINPSPDGVSAHLSSETTNNPTKEYKLQLKEIRHEKTKLLIHRLRYEHFEYSYKSAKYMANPIVSVKTVYSIYTYSIRLQRNNVKHTGCILIAQIFFDSRQNS